MNVRNTLLTVVSASYEGGWHDISTVSPLRVLSGANEGGTGIDVIGTVICDALNCGDGNITNVGDIALDTISSDDTTITITGNTTFADGAYDFDIASHDTSNGLKLGGVLVTSTAAELNILDGVTSSTAELNLLDGVTSTTAELNLLAGVTSTTAELNILDDVTSTTAELNLLDGSSAGTIVNSKGVVYGSSGEVNATTLQIGGTSITSTAAELNVLDGVTAGTVTASLGVVVDGNKDIGSFRNITLTGELDAATLDISGDADIGSGDLFVNDSEGRVAVGYADTSSDSGMGKFSIQYGGASEDGCIQFDVYSASDRGTLDNKISSYARPHGAYPLEIAGSHIEIATSTDGGLGGYAIKHIFNNEGKVGIGTVAPAATLDVTGTDAIIIPVGTTGQRPTAEAGMFRYNSTLSQFEGYTSSWGAIGGGGGGGDEIKDADDDTKIQVEEGSDEDKIRFDVAGTEEMVMDATGTVINDGGNDRDFRIESKDDTHTLYVSGGSAGKVGIGESSPSERLTVAGNISAADLVYGTNVGRIMTVDENSSSGDLEVTHDVKAIIGNGQSYESSNITVEFPADQDLPGRIIFLRTTMYSSQGIELNFGGSGTIDGYTTLYSGGYGEMMWCDGEYWYPMHGNLSS